ncbi:MAG TPA: hypothetical protein DCO75_00280 [Fibrobacteres bacterium]|jgi:hypothetical protein|nr:hypothetical protein [Fibrobacterota bacterium]
MISVGFYAGEIGTEMGKSYFPLPEIFVCVLAFILLSIFPESVPGLHMDEAWSLVQAHKIASGAHPLNGTNGYSGTIFQYLLVPVFKVFGYKVVAMKIACAFLNTLTVFFAMLFVRSLYIQKNYHLYFGLLLCTFPIFLTHSRFCIGATTLHPLFLFTGLFLLTKALQTVEALPRRNWALLGGFLWGLAAYDHIIEITLPVALAVSTVIFYRRELLRNRLFIGWSLSGFIAGFSPRILSFAHQYISQTHGASAAAQGHLGLFNFLIDIVHVPIVFSGIWDGGLVYQRMAGESVLPVVPYVSISLLVLVVINLFWLKSRFERFDKAAVFAFILYCSAIIVVSPGLAIQYFEMPMLVVPYLLVRLIMPLVNQKTKNYHLIGIAIFLLLVFLNSLYLSTNYFFQLYGTGGKLSVFTIGKRITDTSNHFVGEKTLYQQIRGRNIGVVASQLSIILPMFVYDYPDCALKFIAIKHNAPSPDSIPASTRAAIIFYNGPTPELNPVWMRNRDLFYPPYGDSIQSGTMVFRLDNGFDRHFKVYVAEPMSL